MRDCGVFEHDWTDENIVSQLFFTYLKYSRGEGRHQACLREESKEKNKAGKIAVTADLGVSILVSRT